MKTTFPLGTLNRLWTDSNHWRGGIIYVCKDDPRIIVPKKPRWGGWTLNFAHAAAWLALLVCMLSFVVPTVCLALAGLLGTKIWFGFLAANILVWCALSWMLAAPGKYERRNM